MNAITEDEYFRKLQTVGDQFQEIDDQSSIYLTCECGVLKKINYMYHCLYCEEWYCKKCAEKHFDKTVAEWRKEHPNPF